MYEETMQLEIRQVLAAQRRISRHIRATPLVYSHYLSEETGARVWLKPECWQVTGSFKARGALNKVNLLEPDQRARGIVTGSAGNHGLGVAYAARATSEQDNTMRADVFVPATAPRTKVQKLQQLGAQVHETGQTYEDAHQAAERFAERTGALYISAYDDLDVIAGQGTVGVEIVRELPEVEVILVPVGGGGLVAGVAAVAKAAASSIQVIGVQPKASPAALLSLQDGVPYDPYDHEPTIADGLAGGFGQTPFRVARHLIDDILLAGEAQIRHAIYTLLHQHQMVVEPSGAIAISPLLTEVPNVRGRNVVCVLTGKNIETTLLYEILHQHLDH
jgi:threonine dehydratase